LHSSERRLIRLALRSIRQERQCFKPDPGMEASPFRAICRASIDKILHAQSIEPMYSLFSSGGRGIPYFVGSSRPPSRNHRIASDARCRRLATLQKQSPRPMASKNEPEIKLNANCRPPTHKRAGRGW
jgi:hypothetical protein